MRVHVLMKNIGGVCAQHYNWQVSIFVVTYWCSARQLS